MKKHEIQKKNVNNDNIKYNSKLFTFFFYFLNMIRCSQYLYSIDTFGLIEGENVGDARAITIQREQYGGTVYLFIGTGRSPNKIISMSLLTNYNHNTNY
jgi:hypothetical protein